MAGQPNTLGIIAGAGELPLAIARASEADGRSVFVVALDGMAAAADVAAFPHAFVSLGELGKAIRILRDAGCSEVAFAGKVSRPEFSKLKVDVKGALALPRVIAAATKGDDALLRALVGIIEGEGFRVVGSTDAAATLAAPSGAIGRLKPTTEQERDIRQAVRVVGAIGALDIGQAAVVCEGLVLAVEAAEGTDAMLQRVAGCFARHGGKPQRRAGQERQARTGAPGGFAGDRYTDGRAGGRSGSCRHCCRSGCGADRQPRAGCRRSRPPRVIRHRLRA